MSLRNTSKTVAAIRKAVVPHPTVKAPWQWGVVDSFTTTPPLTCNIYINGTQHLGNAGFLTKNVRYLESFVPYKGAVVLIGHGTGGLVSDRVILGDLAGAKIPVQGTITEITSTDGSVEVTDAFGPVVNLEVSAISIPDPLPVLTVGAVVAGTTGQTVVGTSATPIASPRADRTGLSIKNISSATQSVFVGWTSGVTTSTGDIIEPGDRVTTADPGQPYGIVASGSVTVYWEDE